MKSFFDYYSEYLIGLETRAVQHAHGIQLSLDGADLCMENELSCATLANRI